jgi:imidazolonepropionase-like amidohydrolase
MISGLMDFNCCGVLTGEALPDSWIRELIHMAHEEGFSVMAHANGAETVLAAAAAGVDSVEHGAYQSEESLRAMQENKIPAERFLAPENGQTLRGKRND